MTNLPKSIHQEIGFISLDECEIVGYAHQRHKKGECRWCDYMRVESITKEFIRRMEECSCHIKTLNMWSLGSSLLDTEYNRKGIMRLWHEFAWAMRSTPNWRPVFRILESGRRRLLHFHVVVPFFVDHSIVIKAWRSLTGEASNVHVSGGSYFMDPKRLCRYLMKYLSKESSNYRWMGPFYGRGRARESNIRKDNLNRKYGGETYGSYTTNNYIKEPKIIEEY